jgi:murein DD-endopeptidase MepM/ murein hydrolase activator NlpD
MAQGFADRLLTIAVTATVTSAAWVVAGGLYFGREDGSVPTSSGESSRDVAVQQQSPVPAPSRPSAAPAPAGAGELIVPVAGVARSALSDTFTDERAGGERLHEALDIMAPAGTPIVAAAPGTVERLFRSGAGGNTVYVRSADRRTIHYYAHLQDYAPGLKEGQAVRQGEALGTVGASGNADVEAPHLHFAILRTVSEAEWWEPARAINPYPLLRGT